MTGNDRIAKNTLFLYFRLIVVSAISIYTSRIVLLNLGISDYGLYSVVCSVTVSFVFFNNAMNSSVQRYLSYSIGKGDSELVHRVFNISRVIHFVVGFVVVLICECFGLWFIIYKMNIPSGREDAVFWAFQLSLVAVFFSMISVPYNALLIARERMNAFAYISIVEVIIKLFIAYLIAVSCFDRLIMFALLMAVSQILIRYLYRIYCEKHFEECSFRLYKYDSLYREIISFALWGMLGHISYVVNTSFQDMLLNSFFTPVVNAARGIALKVSGTIGHFTGGWQAAVSPQITKSWVNNSRERTYSLIYISSRFSIYLVWLFALPIILCVDDILSIWLVSVPLYTDIFVIFILLNSLVYCTSNPLIMAIRANGKVKRPELWSGAILILNLPLSYLFLKMGGDAWVVFLIMIICNILAHLVRLYYSHIYIGLSIKYYFIHVCLKPATVIVLSSIMPFLFRKYIIFDIQLVSITFTVIVSTISIGLVIYTIGLAGVEKAYLIMTIKKKLAL